MRRDGEVFFLQKQTFCTVFQFKVSVVENCNEKVLQMLVSSLVNVALAVFSHKMNECQIVL